MVMQHYRWDFYGLSTQEKPTPEQSEKVVNGSTFYCADTSKLYVFCDGTWYEKTVSGGGGGSSYTAGDGIDITNDVISTTNTGKPIVLTTADYNYPAGNPTSVGLWLLPEGFYTQQVGVNVRVNSGTTVSSSNASYFLVGKVDSEGRTHIASFSADSVYYYTVVKSSGSQVSNKDLYTNVRDYLTSTSPSAALSANQGRVLKELIDTRSGGLNLLQITQTAYDALATKDPNTLYIIVGA